MAAIFCEYLCKPCEAMAECCGKCWTGLCKAMADCCNGCCECFGACCEGLANCCTNLCAALAKCCAACAQTCSQVFARPFSGCVAFALIANLAPLIACIVVLFGNWNHGCTEKVSEWLVVQLFLFAVNLGFAFYLLARIGKLNDLAPDGNNDAKSAFERNWRFFMYDCGVCIYIVVALFAFSWSIVGLVWQGSCPSGAIKTTALAMGVIMLCFISMGVIVIIFTLMQDYTKACCTDMCSSMCLWKLWCCFAYYPCCYFPECEERTWKGNPPQRGRPAAAEHKQRAPPPAAAHGGGGGNYAAVVVADGGGGGGAYYQGQPHAAQPMAYQPQPQVVVHQPAPVQYQQQPPQLQHQPQQPSAGLALLNLAVGAAGALIDAASAAVSPSQQPAQPPPQQPVQPVQHYQPQPVVYAAPPQPVHQQQYQPAPVAYVAPPPQQPAYTQPTYAVAAPAQPTVVVAAPVATGEAPPPYGAQVEGQPSAPPAAAVGQPAQKAPTVVQLHNPQPSRLAAVASWFGAKN